LTAAEGERRARLALAILRVAVAALLVILGATRVRLGGVTPFGDFLQSRGVPVGAAFAVVVTAVELAGGAALALARFVVPLCVWFGLELTAGILLVHFKEGWFVVGAGRNGMEYSVLLIVALAAIALGEPKRPRGVEQSG
jgi:putative oxidoreductase